MFRTADICLWPGLLTLSGNIIWSLSLPMTTWPPYIPAHVKAETLWTEPGAELTHGTTLLTGLCSSGNSPRLGQAPQTQMLALFRDKVHWQAFWTRLECSPR